MDLATARDLLVLTAQADVAASGNLMARAPPGQPHERAAMR